MHDKFTSYSDPYYVRVGRYGLCLVKCNLIDISSISDKKRA